MADENVFTLKDEVMNEVIIFVNSDSMDSPTIAGDGVIRVLPEALIEFLIVSAPQVFSNVGKVTGREKGLKGKNTLSRTGLGAGSLRRTVLQVLKRDAHVPDDPKKSVDGCLRACEVDGGETSVFRRRFFIFLICESFAREFSG